MTGSHLKAHGTASPMLSIRSGAAPVQPAVSVYCRLDPRSACGPHVMLQTFAAPFNLTLPLSAEAAFELANNLVAAATEAQALRKATS